MVWIISPSCSFPSLRKTLKKLMSKHTSKTMQTNMDQIKLYTRLFPISFQPRNNLIVTKFGPKASHGSLVRVFSNKGVSFHVSSMYSIVYKNWNLFVDKIIVEKWTTLVGDIFKYGSILHAFDFESPNHPQSKRT